MIGGSRKGTSNKRVPTSTDSVQIPLLSGRCLLNNLTWQHCHTLVIMQSSPMALQDALPDVARKKKSSRLILYGSRVQNYWIFKRENIHEFKIETWQFRNHILIVSSDNEIMVNHSLIRDWREGCSSSIMPLMRYASAKLTCTWNCFACTLRWKCIRVLLWWLRRCDRFRIVLLSWKVGWEMVRYNFYKRELIKSMMINSSLR